MVVKRLLQTGILLLVVVVVAGIGWSETRDGPTARSATPTLAGLASPAGTQTAAAARPTRHAKAGQGLGADALTWHILRSYTTHRIKTQYLSSSASGIYLIVDVAAVNSANHAVALNHTDLKLDSASYPLDANALSTLELAGRKALTGILAPQTAATGWLVFDVRPAAVTAVPKLCLADAAPHAGTTDATGCTSA